MKKIIMMCACALVLAGCDEKPPHCPWENSQPEKTQIAFNECMDRFANARAGRDYTANDDEDMDDVIDSCKYYAFNLYPRIRMCRVDVIENIKKVQP